MKKTLLISSAVLFIGLQFVLQSRSTILYLDFLIDQEIIARELCVEKEVENNTCQGKCHLKKILNQEEDQQNNENQFTVEHIRVFQFFEDTQLLIPEPIYGSESLDNPICVVPYFKSPTLSIPAPPPKNIS